LIQRRVPYRAQSGVRPTRSSRRCSRRTSTSRRHCTPRYSCARAARARRESPRGHPAERPRRRGATRGQHLPALPLSSFPQICPQGRGSHGIGTARREPWRLRRLGLLRVGTDDQAIVDQAEPEIRLGWSSAVVGATGHDVRAIGPTADNPWTGCPIHHGAHRLLLIAPVPLRVGTQPQVTLPQR
jgi:hypothetical protein